MWAYAQAHGPTRPDEPVFGARFFMDRDAYQEPSQSFNCITVAHTQHIFGQAARAWDLIGPWAAPDRIEPLMNYIQFHRAAGADYEVGGRRYGVFAHDWRRMDLTAWIEATGANELAGGFRPPGPGAEPPVLALSHAAFAEAVRGALRDLHRPEALARSPLLRCRLVRDRGGSVDAVVELIEEAATVLRADPRDEKLHRALARTYLRPAATQEAAAEALGLPFSTYRRHLTRAVGRVCELLWERELHGT